MDNAFIKNLTEIIEAHIGDPQFGVDQLARQMHMSYSSLWRRVSMHTGKSANQLIREIRLRKALEILQTKECSVADVAYQTGFSSPSYFSSCFQEFFGYSPGEVQKIEEKMPGDLKDVKEVKDAKGVKGLKGVRIVRGFKGVRDAKGFKRWLVLAGLGILAVVVIVASVDWGGGKKISIAVLSPTNLNQDARTGSFCGGMQEQLLNGLEQLGNLEVRSRISAERFKTPEDRMQKIGRKLKADYIIESNVNSEGDVFFVRVQLIETKNDNHSWSNSYQRRMDDHFTLQDDIVREIIQELKSRLLPDQSGTLQAKLDHDPEAGKLYKQGNFYADFLNFRPEYALENYRKAIRTDSLYGEAYLGISRILNQMYADIEIRRDSLAEESFQAIQKAAGINRNLAGVHEQLGLYYFYTGDFNRAIEECMRELEINPVSKEALYTMARAWTSLGRWEKAENSLTRALALGPYTVLPHSWLGWFYEHIRDYKKAEKHYHQAISIHPTHGPSIYGQAGLLLKTGGDPSQARARLDTLVVKDHRYSQDSLRLLYQYAMIDLYEGKYQDALNRLPDWTRATAPSPPYYFRPKFLLEALACGLLKKPELERQYYDSARVFIENLQKTSKGTLNDPRATAALGIAYAGLGMAQQAVACADKTVELLTARPDALMGPYAMEDAAWIYASTGHPDRAVEILQELLNNPGPLTTSILEIDPRWAALRKSPEYKIRLLNRF